MKKHNGSSQILVIGAIFCLLVLLCIMCNYPKNNDTATPNYAINTTSVTSDDIDDLETSEDVVEAYENGSISFEAVQECKERGILEDNDFENLIVLAFEKGDIDELELGEFYQEGNIDVNNLEELYEAGELDKGDIIEMKRDGSLDNEEVNEILSSY